MTFIETLIVYPIKSLDRTTGSSRLYFNDVGG
jgi:hypothetical protein